MAQKPTSRRHLAAVLHQAVPVVNEHADRLEFLKGHQDTHENRLAALETGQAEDRQSWLPKALTWRQRASWLLMGTF